MYAHPCTTAPARIGPDGSSSVWNPPLWLFLGGSAFARVTLTPLSSPVSRRRRWTGTGARGGPDTGSGKRGSPKKQRRRAVSMPLGPGADRRGSGFRCSYDSALVPGPWGASHLRPHPLRDRRRAPPERSRARDRAGRAPGPARVAPLYTGLTGRRSRSRTRRSSGRRRTSSQPGRFPTGRSCSSARSAGGRRRGSWRRCRRTSSLSSRTSCPAGRTGAGNWGWGRRWTHSWRR